MKKSFFALEAAAGQAMVKVADAATMFVAALEEALDIPQMPLSPAPLLPGQPSGEQVKLAAQAASSVVDFLMGSNNPSLIGPAVQAAVAQSLAAFPQSVPTPQKAFSLPGWLLVVVGGGFARFFH